MTENEELKKRIEVLEKKVELLEKAFDTIQKKERSQKLNEICQKDSAIYNIVCLFDSIDENFSRYFDFQKLKKVEDTILRTKLYAEKKKQNEQIVSLDTSHAISRTNTNVLPRFSGVKNIYKRDLLYKKISNTGVAITGYRNSQKVVADTLVIPNNIDGYAIEKIQPGVFNATECTVKIRNFVLPSNLLYLNCGAFVGYWGHYDFPINLIFLGQKTKLEGSELPKNVTIYCKSDSEMKTDAVRKGYNVKIFSKCRIDTI